MGTIRVICVALMGIWSLAAECQQDTSYLNYDQLHWSDVDQSTTTLLSTKVISGTRTERNLEDLPFTIFVITAKEIKDRGYFTLVDAIRHLPGIRVSQPGSGLDGETFMMRGLYGNAYAKILINDVVIKPSVVGAMPIGSQLPIRQAERIEVIYGPAATLYGSDAAAGVINIILKENEYPTYAQADIEVGENDLTRLNAMFGGKVALGNKTLKLKMYGGFTSFIDRRIKYDQDVLYNPEVYQRSTGQDALMNIPYQERPNYAGTTGSARLSNLPHQSNYIGFSASIGSFEFNTQRLSRSDHSSLGLNPYAVSYADPQSLFGEKILTTSVVFKKQYSKWNFNIKAASLEYSIIPLSSYNYVLPTFGVVTNLFFLRGVQQNSSINGVSRIDSLYLAGPRYVSSSSSDFSLEAQANFTIDDHVSLSVGWQASSGFNLNGIERFKMFPGRTRDQVITPAILSSRNAQFSEGNAFIEGYFNYGQMHAMVGAQVFVRSDSLVQNAAEFNPRVGLLYQVTPALSVRTSFSTAFRYPTAFFAGTTYQVKAEDDFIDVVAGSPNLEPERTISIESGIRYTPSPSWHIDGSIFYTRTSNYINYDLTQGASESSLLWGYRNDPQSFNRLIGGQVSLHVENIWPAINLAADFNLSYSKGKERVLAISLDDFELNELQDLPVIRGQPDFIGFVRMSFEAGDRLDFYLDHSFMTSSWTKNKLRITQGLAQSETDQLENEGYYTLDLRSVFTVSRQLSAYVSISNLLNIQYAGIDASFEPDILLYNPQPKRYMRFGVNFAFN